MLAFFPHARSGFEAKSGGRDFKLKGADTSRQGTIASQNAIKAMRCA